MKIDNIQVHFTDDDLTKSETFYEIDKFFEWLVEKGVYDNIRATKDFSVTKEVMSRLKGER